METHRAFHAQKQEPAWTPQPGRADLSFLGFAQCLMHGDLNMTELPGLSHPHTLAFPQNPVCRRETMAHQKGDKDTAGPQSSTQQTSLQNQVWLTASILTAKRGFSWSRRASEQHSWMQLLGKKIFSKVFTSKSLSCPAGYHSHLSALCHRTGAAGQRTLHLCAHRHSLSMENQNQRYPRCSEKCRVIEKACQEEQLCLLDPRKGFRHPWQAWDCGSSWLSSPYICPWEMSWGKISLLAF